MNLRIQLAVAVCAALARSTDGVRAAICVEWNDAGQTPANAQGAVIAGSVDLIRGRIDHAFDVDLFRIGIVAPSAFSASISPPYADAPDLQLFLFDSRGRGVAANDNWIQSTAPRLPTGSLVAEPPGEYLLGVAPSNDDPLGIFGEIFPDAATGVVRPAGLSMIDTLLGWTRDFTAVGGDYGIALTATRGLVALAADFDENGQVDGNDLARWRNGFGLEGDAGHGQGDADADGDTDGADFLAWQRQVGGGATTLAASGGVPEPSSFALLLAAGFISLTASRRRTP